MPVFSFPHEVLMRFSFLKNKFFKFLILLVLFFIFYKFWDDYEVLSYSLPRYKTRDDHKAFITSSYFYPKSKSLGDNSLALVMSFSGSARRKEWMNLEQWDELNTPLITVRAENSTSSIVVRTKYKRITPHENCRLVSIFATVQLLPNVQRVSMLGDDGGQVEIPFQLPATTPHDVVICINPVFLADQWQNFIFMAHLYKQFDGFVNLYFISAIDSIYSLMREYEKEGYLRIQLWPSVKFQGVPRSVLDPYESVEYANLASASTDCLLQYKESAKYVTFLDLNDLLIPTRGPTFLEEFQNSVWSWRNVQYLYYRKEHYEMVTTRNLNSFSFSTMFKSLKNRKMFQTGKIVANTALMSYTWMHGPPTIPKGSRYVEADVGSSITHVKLKWIPKYNETYERRFYNSSLDNFMDPETLGKIELDVERMKSKPAIREILGHFPKYHFFTDAIYRCYYHNQTDYSCPGPHLCGIPQFKNVNCMHVRATYNKMPELKPITYFYATNASVVAERGCLPPH